MGSFIKSAPIFRPSALFRSIGLLVPIFCQTALFFQGLPPQNRLTRYWSIDIIYKSEYLSAAHPLRGGE